jgi:RimJ/RimL family protein N-acetyltransferase
LRKPVAADADQIYKRYAADPEVTRFVGWPTHTSLEQTKAFLAYCDAEWDRWPAGAYLIEDRTGGRLLGSTGLAFETETTAVTGYVLARDAWGHGYATEALIAIVQLARNVGLRHLYALCHSEHQASIRVLEKCGFRLKHQLEYDFPNLAGGCRATCVRYELAMLIDIQ